MQKLLLCTFIISLWTIGNVIPGRITPVDPEINPNIQKLKCVKKLKKKIYVQRLLNMELQEHKQQLENEKFKEEIKKILSELAKLEDKLEEIYHKLAPEYYEQFYEQ